MILQVGSDTKNQEAEQVRPVLLRMNVAVSLLIWLVPKRGLMSPYLLKIKQLYIT